MVVNYYFYCILWRVYMTLFSQWGLWFVLKRAYAKEWGSPHKNSWLKCKMIWTEHKDVLACLFLFHSAAPSLHRAGQAAAAPARMHRAHSSCYRSHFSKESLCYFCASSHDILAWNHKGGSAKSNRRAHHDLSQYAWGTGRHLAAHRDPFLLLSSQPLLDIPSPSHNKHRPAFLGCKRKLCGCTPMIPWGHMSPWTHIERCGWTRS